MTEQKRMLAILGSPHKHGSTAAMLESACSAALESGWQVDRVYLYEKQIGFCTGCRACVSSGNCVQKDDIQAIADLLRACDLAVLAAPTYWANVPAAVKNMFDRLLGVAMEDTSAFPRPRLSSKQKYLLLTACNTPFPFSWLCGQSRGTLRAMEEFFKTSGMKRLGKVTYANAHKSKRLPKTVSERIRRYWG